MTRSRPHHHPHPPGETARAAGAEQSPAAVLAPGPGIGTAADVTDPGLGPGAATAAAEAAGDPAAGTGTADETGPATVTETRTAAVAQDGIAMTD